MTEYNNLLCALDDDIDPITGFNYFNGCSKTYHIDKEENLTHPIVVALDQWKYCLKTDKNILKCIINEPFENVTYKKIKEISDNEKYFYMINFFNVDFIFHNKQIGFKYIPEKVLKDVSDKKAFIILHCSTEGYSGSDKHPNDLNIIQDWINQANLPSNNVIYINGNLISNNIKSPKVKYIIKGISVMDSWIISCNVFDIYNYSPIDFKPTDNSFLYLNLTRDPRPHRIYLLSSLLANNLFKFGKNSFNMLQYSDKHNGKFATDVIRDPTYNFYASDEIIKGAELLDKIGKQFVDIDNTNAESCLYSTDKIMYERTFLSIICETIFSSNSIFITEKTWRSISIGHPFMILGSKGILKELKKMGYKTFSRWIDESYDDSDTIVEKVNTICKNIQKFKNMSLSELCKIREEMKEICTFNQNHFANELRRKYYINNEFIKHKPILDILSEYV